jgi:hypothetical protein
MWFHALADSMIYLPLAYLQLTMFHVPSWGRPGVDDCWGHDVVITLERLHVHVVSLLAM